MTLQSLLRRATHYVALTNAALAIATAAAGAILVWALFATAGDNLEGQALKFAVHHDITAKLDQSSALRILESKPALILEHSTRRAETPFWLLTRSGGSARNQDAVFELPSRHIQTIEYWLYDSDGKAISSGSVDRDASSNENARRVRAGFAIAIPASASDITLLARVIASGPARLSISQQLASELNAAAREFDRSGGVLFGSLLMIAAFSLLIALLARDFTFFVFGAWVVSSLRFASYSAGWDLGWLGHQYAEDYPVLVRNLPLAAYAVFTVTLFWAIFRRDIARLRAAKHIRVLLVLSVGLLIAGALLSHRSFLPLLWAVVFPSVAVLMWLTVRIFLRTGSAAAAWYGASWLASLTGVLSEVAFAAGFTASKPTLVSSLGSAVVSALLAGIALAQRLRSERSGRVAAQAKALSVLKRFRENYNSMPVGLFSANAHGRVSLCNPAFAAMFGLPGNTDLSEGATHLDSLLGHGAATRLREAGRDSSETEVEWRLAGDGIESRWFLIRVSSKGASIEGSIQDITTRKEAESKLRHLVDHDSLTGMLNRRGLEEALRIATDSAARGTRCAIAHVDLDRFKLVNDLYGHAVGDAILQETAARLESTVRSKDMIARIADSFVILFLDCPDHAVSRLTERLREAVGDHPFELHGKGLNMTVSVGLVPIEHSMSAVDAMAAADRACAEAKARGRNCVVRLDDKDATLKRHLEELRVVADLQQRIPTDRYFLEFQPIVSLRSARASLCYEVLIRMRDEQDQVVPPGRFIGAAERNGLMSQIDRWVLRNTLEWLDQHPDHRDRLTFATINISGASLNDSRFVDDAFAMIAEHPLAVTKLCFEITESVALNDLSSTRRFVDRVRNYGSKLALDDFGAGYTSFNYLKEIPADFIKIDGSFVRDINRNPANYAITRTIVDLTHELGMRSIAEWAETADTIASLIELRVDFGQGFALARPMAKDFLANADSSGSLVRDVDVISLLDAIDRQPLSLHPAGSRRH